MNVEGEMQQEGATAWKSWSVGDWNGRLLEHFFAKHGEAPPLAVLLVTSEELAKATGDAAADATEVRNYFVEAVRRGSKEKDLFEDASNYQGFPELPPLARPRFVAHLILTCLAASESSDELGDENSFIARLKNLVGNFPDSSLSILPILWQHLQRWLASHRETYRELMLPDPGGFTRIGYTTKLTFPDRRDQQRLSDLLDAAGLAGTVPPVSLAVALVSDSRSTFSIRFRDALDDFRAKHASGAHTTSTNLSSHRLWAAVVEAALHGRGRSHTEDSNTQFSILGEDDNDALSLIVVSNSVSVPSAVTPMPLPTRIGSWEYGIVPAGAQIGGAHGLKETIHSLLSGELRLAKLSSRIEQGVLPFVVESHGLLELADRGQLALSSVALVQESLLADLLKLYPSGTPRKSLYPNWVQVDNPGLSTRASSDFCNTALTKSWILHETLSPRTISLRGGIGIEGGYLGMLEVLPLVIATGANSVALLSGSTHQELSRDSEGRWKLPPQDIDGEAVLTAKWEDGEATKLIRFHPSPASEAYKVAVDRDAWIVESLRGTATLSDELSSECFAGSEESDFIGDPILLGPDIGEFVAATSEAAWIIERIGTNFSGRRGEINGDAVIPKFQVNNANARRRWRKLLLQCVADPNDADFESARRNVKGLLSSGRQLPAREIVRRPPALTPHHIPRQKVTVDRLVRAVAGRASRRAGIPWREWVDLSSGILGIDPKQIAPLTRAWQEASLIDVASSAKWRSRLVYAVAPRLVAIRSGGLIRASVSGLTLPVTSEQILRTAESLGVQVEEIHSVSAFVPSRLALHGHDEQDFRTLARQCNIGLKWTACSLLRERALVQLPGSEHVPTQYESAGEWMRWSLQLQQPVGAKVEYFIRPDRPSYWLASVGRDSFWSYELNPVRVWVARLLNVPLVMPTGDADLVATHGYLPLPLARLCNLFGPALSGPQDDGSYLYPMTSKLRQEAFDIMSTANLWNEA